MSLCNQTTSTGVVCLKAWLQHQNAPTPTSLSVPVSTPNAASSSSCMVAPTQAPAAICASPLNTQSANIDHVNHFQNLRRGVPTSAFNAPALRRSTGQRNIAPRPFRQENIPVASGGASFLHVSSDAICCTSFCLLAYFCTLPTWRHSMLLLGQISLTQRGASFIFIMQKQRACSSVFKTCSCLSLSASVLCLPSPFGSKSVINWRLLSNNVVSALHTLLQLLAAMKVKAGCFWNQETWLTVDALCRVLHRFFCLRAFVLPLYGHIWDIV